MPLNGDDTASFGDNPRHIDVGTAAFSEEDYHLIDDPPEYEEGRGDLDAEDNSERVPAGAPQSEDKPVSAGDETPERDPAAPGKAARLRGATCSAAGTLGEGIAGAGKVFGGWVSNVYTHAERFASDSIRKVPVGRLHKPVTSGVAIIGNAHLATDVAVRLDQWMRTVFASGKASAYDRALDQTYRTLQQYGGDHRIFDGSHDVVGAWKAITEANPHDAWLHRAEGYVLAIWKDMATPSGLPVVTWNKQAFDAVAGFLNETLGISRTWTKDMATFTATEFIGAVLGAIAMILSWNRADIRRFSEIVASLGLSALVGANPIMVMITIVGLAKCFHEARHGAGFKRVLSGTGRGMIGTTALLGASSLMPAPAWVTVMLGVVSYLVAARLYDKAEPRAEEVARIVCDWFGSQEWTSSCSYFARNTYLRGKAVVGNVSVSELKRDVANTVSAWSLASANAIESAWSTGYRSTIGNACAALPQWSHSGP